jgi:hypothetical protein
MAMSGTPEPPEERLPCGRTLRSVWEAWDEGPAPGGGDPHPADCPHCAAALDRLAVLEDFAREVRSEDARQERDDATLAAADAVTARVMDIVRLELRPGRTLPLGAPDEDAWIVEAAAAKVLRSAVDALPGVRAGSCRISPLDPAPAPAGGARGPLRARIEVAADLTWTVPELAAAVRERVLAAATDAVGMEVAAVDVAVVDILGPPGPGGEDSTGGRSR